MFTSVMFLPKMHNVILNMRKNWTNKWRNFQEDNRPTVFKIVKVMKAKEKMRNCCCLKKIKEI